MKKENWIWMPHPSHFICAYRCRFILSTYVGRYIVSTVGEMTKLHEQDGDEFENIGCDRKYETSVFPAKKSKSKCCPYEVSDYSDQLDFCGYNDAGKAYKGHIKLCKKWSKK